MFGWGRRQKEQNSIGRVVVLIDYDNIYLGTRAVGKAFPVKELQGLGRKYGIAEPPQIFLSHFTPHDKIMALGRQGFDLHICPPDKLGGQDTVDARIYNECQRFADHPGIKTFIIVSNDADFGRTEEFLRNHHKRVVRFELDEGRRVLTSADGDIIELPDYCHTPELIRESQPAERNDFAEIIQRRNIVEVDAYDEKKTIFLKQVVEACAKVHRLDDRRRSFVQLRSLIWNLIHMEAIKHGFSQNDCHAAMDALINETDVLKLHRQEISPRVYYVFNPAHGLFRS